MSTGLSVGRCGQCVEPAATVDVVTIEEQDSSFRRDPCERMVYDRRAGKQRQLLEARATQSVRCRGRDRLAVVLRKTGEVHDPLVVSGDPARRGDGRESNAFGLGWVERHLPDAISGRTGSQLSERKGGRSGSEARGRNQIGRRSPGPSSACLRSIGPSSNENTNRLLRQYFPKGQPIDGYSQVKLNAVARELNEQPRQTLNFKTPAEITNGALTG